MKTTGESGAGRIGAMTQELLALRYELEAFTIDFWHEVDIQGGGRAAACYLDDGVFATSVREYRGRAELDAFYARRRHWEPRVSIHVVSNFRIDAVDAGAARCGYILGLFAADGEPVLPSGPPVMLGTVEEVLVRQQDGSWRYASRRVLPLFRDGTPTRG
ncbi:nuclear transport factor 2 family protein [Caenimonas terrae]|uniref:Nuclear transport factor 2 family protein n=1 Tax=Caenimonas terrae TaxID=696074 RepID=A0ABW0NJM4_9BURK